MTEKLLTGFDAPVLYAMYLDKPIVHELLHFSVPNHGKLWKSLMRAHLGPYETMEEKLRNVEHRTSKSPA